MRRSVCASRRGSEDDNPWRGQAPAKSFMYDWRLAILASISKARVVEETRALENGVGEGGVGGDASDVRCFLSGVSPSLRGELGSGNGA